MRVTLKPAIGKRIDERVKSGQYASAQDVIAAAVVTLEQQERFGDFAPGELGRLLEEGERSIAEGGTLDGTRAFKQRRARRHRR